jgi:hypothetical protein
MDSSVAILKLVEVATDGSRSPLSIELGQPHPHQSGGWATHVAVDGNDRHSQNIYGDDSMQALCLGLRFVRLHLELALGRGSRLVDDEGSDFPFHAYFEKVLDEKPSA